MELCPHKMARMSLWGRLINFALLNDKPESTFHVKCSAPHHPESHRNRRRRWIGAHWVVNRLDVALLDYFHGFGCFISDICSCDWPIPDEKIFAEVEEKACLHKALPGCCVWRPSTMLVRLVSHHKVFVINIYWSQPVAVTESRDVRWKIMVLWFCQLLVFHWSCFQVWPPLTPCFQCSR